MDFAELYGAQLDRRLSSADTTALFTTARRKAAINEAQRWFLVETECLTLTAAIAIVDGTGEYDLEDEIADDDFLSIAKQGPELKRDPGGGGTILYSAGDDFYRTSIARLNTDEPGWRSASAGMPQCWYERIEGGEHVIGMFPKPDVPAGATWTLNVPYVVDAATLSADADEPFTVDGNARRALRPWHDALADYAAAQLELLRKGLERHGYFMALAQQRVEHYRSTHKAPGGKTVRFVRNYRRESRSGSRWGDQDEQYT